jgi:hypothetical protein
MGACKMRAVFGIAASAFSSIDDMAYNQYRPILPFDMVFVTMHALLFLSLIFKSRITNGALSVN